MPARRKIKPTKRTARKRTATPRRRPTGKAPRRKGNPVKKLTASLFTRHMRPLLRAPYNAMSWPQYQKAFPDVKYAVFKGGKLEYGPTDKDGRRINPKRARNSAVPVTRVSDRLLEAITSIDSDASYTTSRDGATHMALERGNGGIIVQAPRDRGYSITTRSMLAKAKTAARVSNPVKLRAGGKAVSLRGRKSLRIVKRGGKAFLEVR